MPSSKIISGSFLPVLLVVLGLWSVLIYHLQTEWSVNPQYSYGWFVPVFCLYALARRWQPTAFQQGARWSWWWFPAAIAFFLAYYPHRLVQEANPDWRLITWTQAFLVLGFSLFVLYCTAGVKALRRYGPALLLFLLAVPWPTPLENKWVQQLSFANTAIAVEVLSIFGYPVLQRGTLIETPHGLLGVDEACSGIRSFQASLMIALCLVEYFRFSKKHRISLVCLGLGLSLAGNLLRTLLLIFLGAKLGMEQVNRWHDPAGLTVLIACFGGLWFYCFRHQNKALPPKQERPAAEPLLVRLPSISQGVTALVLFLGTEAMVQSWYRKAESVLPRRSALKVDWPQEASAYRTTPISYKVRSILRYSSGQAATWVDEKGTLWSMYHLQWNPGRASAHLARSHKPEVCLPAGGGTLKKYLGLHRIPVGDTALPFRAYEFEIEGHPFFVFHCLWEESTAREAVGVIELDARNRVDLVFRRERQLGQNLLQLGLAPKEVLPFEKVTEQVEALLKQRVVLERKAQPGSA